MECFELLLIPFVRKRKLAFQNFTPSSSLNVNKKRIPGAQFSSLRHKI